MECEIKWEKVTLDLSLIHKKMQTKYRGVDSSKAKLSIKMLFDIHHRYLPKHRMFHLSPEAKE